MQAVMPEILRSAASVRILDLSPYFFCICFFYVYASEVIFFLNERLTSLSRDLTIFHCEPCHSAGRFKIQLQAEPAAGAALPFITCRS